MVVECTTVNAADCWIPEWKNTKVHTAEFHTAAKKKIYLQRNNFHFTMCPSGMFQNEYLISVKIKHWNNCEAMQF